MGGYIMLNFTNNNNLGLQQNFGEVNRNRNIAAQRLSSGLQLNSAADAAAEIAIANRLISQLLGLEQSQRNANDAISLAQVAEGALGQVNDGLQRIRELAIRSANGTNTAADRQALQAEVNQIQQQISDIASDTTFNGLNLLDGNLQNVNFQIGTEANQTVSLSIPSFSDIARNIDISTEVDANAAISTTDTSLTSVNSVRAELGAVQNRFESAINSQEVAFVNQSSTLSVIRDANFAAETANLVRNDILSNVNVAVLAQSNAQSGLILQLING